MENINQHINAKEIIRLIEKHGNDADLGEAVRLLYCYKKKSLNIETQETGFFEDEITCC